LNFTTDNPALPTNALSYACPAGNVLIDTTTDDGKALLKLVIAARQNNLVLSRIDYAPNASGACYASLIEF
jgi:hypothetical protein